ncbi:ABC transporter ATP-binding protein, partial [bacterium]|nr:ABC transporter ATP-binding protein [bacterium]
NVLGAVPSERTVAEAAGSVGFVFQEFENQLFSTNVEQEVAFGPENLGVDPDEIRSRVAECLRLVGLSGFENREPATLSGGEKQRLAIASVLSMKPDLLLLDEPTTDLDPEGRASVHRIIRSLRAAGATILLVEHDVESLLDFDVLALMQCGKIKMQGSPSALCADPKLLSDAGVRPHQIAVAYKKLDIQDAPLDLDEARRAVNERFTPDRERYSAIVEQERRDAQKERPSEIEACELTHSFERGSFAIHDVSLKVGQGEFVAIVGRNGSGKTTFAKHLNGLLKPSEGKAIIRERDVQKMRLSELARRVGFVFQNPDSQIFCETVEEEVRFGPRNLLFSENEMRRLVDGAIETVDLKGKEKSDPFCLTKGERQRVAIASTLSCDPDLLILDEPTTGLDFTQERRVMSMLSQLNHLGKTILFITHSLWLVLHYAKRVVCFSDGSVVFDGPVRDFFSPENDSLLADAGLVPPKIVELSHRFGMTALSASEFASFFTRRG